MKLIIEYKRFLAYSEKINKGFFTNFSKGINIVYGKNTSGKSTLLQAIQYTFGINDEQHKLAEILNEKVIFRLDFIIRGKTKEKVTILRDDEFIYIKREKLPLVKFTGIGGNKAEEHKKLKKYLSNLMNFNLRLESSNEYKLASIEAMFLPYYVAQDYGWVLPLKSFRGLDFFRNFKNDYYDYYLGITNEYDRLAKQQLELDKNRLTSKINFLSESEKNNDELNLSKLTDESFISKVSNYIDKYKINKAKQISSEKEYLLACNKLTFLEERLKILRRIKSSIKKQNPLDGRCPTCNQELNNSITEKYEYFQNFHDTEEQISILIKDSKKLKGIINSLEIKINEQKVLVANDYSFLLSYQIDDMTLNTWLDNKANIQLSSNIINQIGKLTIILNEKITELKKFKTPDEIRKERNSVDYKFKEDFEDNLRQLKVKAFDDTRYTLLYKMKLFPRQGVELLKTLLAYNFAFNKTIKKTPYVHRFPFLMDAIFKEDIDFTNRKLILEFISKNSPTDTQTIFSIAETKDNDKTASDYNKEIFNNKANLILINKNSKRSFLSNMKPENIGYLEETLTFLE
ncbi:hypothetical protein [Tenacibaculum ovolyticum]|uniref:hypothetical protein n=1 Tax=Tenacibaculum ovolyticum TaxID=104270 RepID=UPI003BAC5290